MCLWPLAQGLDYGCILAFGLDTSDMNNEEIKSAVAAARMPNESRVKMAKRLAIPYTTLRRMEVFGHVHINAILGAAYLSRLVPIKRRASRK